MKMKIMKTASKKRGPININLPINGWIKLAINIFAMLTSWFLNKSILWAMFHFVFGLAYLVYSLIIGVFKDGGFEEIINYYI